MKRADIERGLADWSERMAGAAQFDKHLARREQERAASSSAKERKTK
jgi:hypothetical protein